MGGIEQTLGHYALTVGSLVLNGVLIPLILHANKLLGELRDHVYRQNGRIGKLEEKLVGHENLDDDRHEELRRQMREVFETLHPHASHSS